MHGGPAPVRRYMPELIDLVLSGKIDPGKVLSRLCRSRNPARRTRAGSITLENFGTAIPEA